MLELLDYDNPSLEVETLKLQIKGPLAQEALKCLYNVKSKERAFEILDAKYGDILMVFPRIKEGLEALKDLPTSMLEESSNIQEIINVCQTLDKYGKKTAIDSGFIQRFRNKLSSQNRRLVTMKKISSYEPFLSSLYEMLAVNDELKITQNENKKIYRNQVKTDVFPTKRKKACGICKSEHLTYQCIQLSQLNDS